MVKGKTKSGIAFEIDERIKDDARLTYLLVKLQTNATDPLEAGKAMNQVMNLLFGSDEAVFNFMEAIASKNDGICSQEVLVAELTDLFNEIKAKN